MTIGSKGMQGEPCVEEKMVAAALRKHGGGIKLW